MRAFRWSFGLAALCAVGAVIAQSAIAGTPALTVTPGSGPPGVTLTVNGSGYGASEAVDVYFDGTDMVVASTTTAGAFSASFKVPSSTSVGTHWVSAVGRVSGLSAQHRFNVHENWPEFGYNALGQRANPYESILNTSNVGSLEEAWSYTTGGQIISSPAVANGIVYVSSTDGSLYALNAATGALKWSTVVGGTGTSSPAVSGGTVYIGAANGIVDAYNAATGALKWSDDLSILEPSGFSNGSPTVAAGMVYIGGQDGVVFQLVAATGFANWAAAPDSGQIESAPAVAGGRVYVHYYDGNVYALNVADGNQAWTTQTQGNLLDYGVAPGVAVSNGRVFFPGGISSSMSAVGASDGSSLWDEQLTGDENLTSPALANGAIYQTVGGEGGLFSFRTTDGFMNYDASDGASLTSPALANGVVYFVALDYPHDKLQAVRASDGAILWSGLLGGYGGVSSPAVSDGSVYVGDFDGTLHAFRLNGSLPAIAKPTISKLKPNFSLRATTMR